MAKVVHVAAFALQASAYYEYVESKANWSDEISREGIQGLWAHRQGFHLRCCGVATIILQLPCFAVVSVFSLL